MLVPGIHLHFARCSYRKSAKRFKMDFSFQLTVQSWVNIYFSGLTPKSAKRGDIFTVEPRIHASRCWIGRATLMGAENVITFRLNRRCVVRGQFSRRRSGGGVSLQGFEEMLHRPPGRLLLCVQSHRLRRHLRQTPRASLACIFPSNEASSTMYRCAFGFGAGRRTPSNNVHGAAGRKCCCSLCACACSALGWNGIIWHSHTALQENTIRTQTKRA